MSSSISKYAMTSDGFLKLSAYGIPIFTYILVALTTVTLAYVTIADNSVSDGDGESASDEINNIIPESTNEPKEFEEHEEQEEQEEPEEQEEFKYGGKYGKTKKSKQRPKTNKRNTLRRKR